MVTIKDKAMQIVKNAENDLGLLVDTETKWNKNYLQIVWLYNYNLWKEDNYLAKDFRNNKVNLINFSNKYYQVSDDFNDSSVGVIYRLIDYMVMIYLITRIEYQRLY